MESGLQDRPSSRASGNERAVKRMKMKENNREKRKRADVLSQCSTSASSAEPCATTVSQTTTGSSSCAPDVQSVLQERCNNLEEDLMETRARLSQVELELEAAQEDIVGLEDKADRLEEVVRDLLSRISADTTTHVSDLEAQFE